MDLFTTLLVKVFSGIMYVIYWLAFRLIRIAWWLSLYLLLTLGAGVAWLARGGHGEPVDTGRFGRYVDGETRWEDHDSGNVYPAAETESEYCEVHAEEAGTYWRRTAIARLLRQGAIIRYRFFALTDGTRERAAWCDFPHEARKDIRLDELDPARASAPELTGSAKVATDANRDMAITALKHIEWLLGQRGWEPVGHSTEMENEHWYAARFSRKVIDWNAPVSAAPDEQAVELPAAKPAEPLGVTATPAESAGPEGAAVPPHPAVPGVTQE